VLGQATNNSNSQDSPWLKLRGSHHLPPYNILCGCPWGSHPNGFLSQVSQVGVLKLPKLGFPWLWGPITLHADLKLRWGLKKSCSPCRELSNNLSHATCMLWSEVKLSIWLPALLLAIICVSDVHMGDACSFYTFTFQELSNDIKNSSNYWVLTPEITLWKFGSPLGVHFPKWELLWEFEETFPHTFHTPGNMRYDSWASLLARNLANPLF